MDKKVKKILITWSSGTIGNRDVPVSKSAKNTTFNIATGKGQSLVEVAKLLKKEMKSKSKLSLKSSRTGEVIRFIANINKAKKVLRFKPSHSFLEGVRLSLEWYQKHA